MASSLLIWSLKRTNTQNICNVIKVAFGVPFSQATTKVLHFSHTCVYVCAYGDRQHTVNHGLIPILCGNVRTFVKTKKKKNIFSSYIITSSGIETLYTNSCKYKCRLSMKTAYVYRRLKDGERELCLCWTGFNVKTMQSTHSTAQHSTVQFAKFSFHFTASLFLLCHAHIIYSFSFSDLASNERIF